MHPGLAYMTISLPRKSSDAISDIAKLEITTDKALTKQGGVDKAARDDEDRRYWVSNQYDII
jgi:hypothetical protein